jgi:BlaI family penicillinase repressor
MGRPAQDITESELSVLRILWDRGPATIRQLTDVLYPQGEAAQYATVQKLLDRMEAKGYVRRDRTMFVHIFRSVLDRDELIGRRLRSLAEMLCEGSLTPLLTHLARAKDLTDDDRLALRAIVDEPDPETGPSNFDHGHDSVVSLGQSPPASSSRSSGNGRGHVGR